MAYHDVSATITVSFDDARELHVWRAYVDTQIGIVHGDNADDDAMRLRVLFDALWGNERDKMWDWHSTDPDHVCGACA